MIYGEIINYEVGNCENSDACDFPDGGWLARLMVRKD